MQFLAALIAKIAMLLLDWAVKRLERPTVAHDAGRDDALVSRIRERVQQYESRIRERRSSDQDRP